MGARGKDGEGPWLWRRWAALWGWAGGAHFSLPHRQWEGKQGWSQYLGRAGGGRGSVQGGTRSVRVRTRGPSSDQEPSQWGAEPGWVGGVGAQVTVPRQPGMRGNFVQGVSGSEASRVGGTQHPWPAALPPPPVCRLLRPSGFHQVSQQSGCDIMRQAGVSGLTSHSPDVWKSPNQNDPTDRLKMAFPKWPLQLPEDMSGQAISITASQSQECSQNPGPTWAMERPPAQGSWWPPSADIVGRMASHPPSNRCEWGCLGPAHETKDSV